MDFLADTGFLIDLWREAGKSGAATRFAREHAARQVGICWVVAGEFMSGGLAANHGAEAIEAFLSRYPVVQSNPHIVGEYARLFAGLRARNGLIGPNDLWIAACAVALDLPLLTANETEFSRVAGLKIVAYRKAKAPDRE
jgi:tRNA(fMet)-specific endonuclease VapC